MILLESCEYFPKNHFLALCASGNNILPSIKEPEPPKGAESVKSQSSNGYELGQTRLSPLRSVTSPAGGLSSFLPFKVSFWANEYF